MSDQKKTARYRGNAKWCLRRARDVRAFKKWLHAGGADLLRPTSQYELLRFRCSGGLSIVYVNERGVPTSKTGVAEEAWTAFVAGAEFPYPPSDAGPILTAAEFFVTDAVLDTLAASRTPITIAEVMTAHRCTMGAALSVLRAGEAAGVLSRSGGQLGTALRWVPAAAGERRAVQHVTEYLRDRTAEPYGDDPEQIIASAPLLPPDGGSPGCITVGDLKALVEAAQRLDVAPEATNGQ